MERLPSETISDILSRLPINSLSETRRVCKSWFRTIYDPFFMEKHIQTLSQNKGLGFILLIKKNEDSDCELYYAEYDDKKLYKITQVNHPPIKYNYDRRALVGSCNGLICISDHINNDPISICNVMTRECINLPAYNNFPIQSDNRSIMVRGFGIDISSNHYKVVRIMFHQWKYQPYEGQVQVYTLGKDTDWRMKAKAPYFLRWQLSGVLVKGVLHWITEMDVFRDNYEDYCYKIVAFDLADEEFQVVPSPPCVLQGKQNFDLVELRGCLCMTEYSFDGPTTVWTKKDYMSKYDSLWTKEYVIEGLYSRCKVLTLTEDNNLLLWYNGVILMSYDPKTGYCRKIEDHGKVKRLEAVTYTKSMVSLKVIGEDPVLAIGNMEIKKNFAQGKRKRQHAI